MPPKPKLSRQEIAQAAFSIIKNEGFSALTARELGARLGTSARPIFTVFNSMDEVKCAARELAVAEFREHIRDFLDYTPAFRRIGTAVVSYGIQKPDLFRLLFTPECTQGQTSPHSLHLLGEISEACIDRLERDYMTSPRETALLFEQMWIHAVGLGAMCAAGMCHPSDEEIEQRLSLAFASLTMFIKTGKLDKIFTTAQSSLSAVFHDPNSDSNEPKAPPTL